MLEPSIIIMMTIMNGALATHTTQCTESGLIQIPKLDNNASG